MVEVLCKQLSHKYVGESHSIRVMSTTAEIVVMNTNWKSSLFDSNYFEELRYLRNSWRTAEKTFCRARSTVRIVPVKLRSHDYVFEGA